MNPKNDEPMALAVTRELIEEFLSAQAERGLSEGTIAPYRRHLSRLYEKLPPDRKEIGADTIREIRQKLRTEGYSERTLNVFTTACNTLLEYCGRRELQDVSRRKTPAYIQPELTRAEYRRLLSAARVTENRRAYLLTKIFALTGISVGDLPAVTVESVEKGCVLAGGRKAVLPNSLRRELQGYARRENIRGGPIFVTQTGDLLNRSVATYMIRSLHGVARVDIEKCNPRSLGLLYRQTMSGIWDNYEVLVEQSYNRLVEREQVAYGWNE